MESGRRRILANDDLPADIPALAAILEGADHVDVKTAHARVGADDPGPSLREFVAGALGYRPGWLVALFAARAVVALFLRLRQAVPTRAGRAGRPADIDFTPGGRVGFFTVVAAEEDRYLLLQASDIHLTGYLALVVDPPRGDRRRYRAITVVRYHRFTGPLYFTLIRPFHHLVVAGMVRAGAGSGPEPEQPGTGSGQDVVPAGPVEQLVARVEQQRTSAGHREQNREDGQRDPRPQRP
jgi:hypothetical protein